MGSFYLIYYSIIFSILFTLSYLICRKGYKKNCDAVSSEPSLRHGPPIKDALRLAIIVVICYVLLAILLHQAWIQNDEWAAIAKNALPIHVALKNAIVRYCTINSRFGEMGLGIATLSLSCWQELVLTPLFSVLAPVTAFMLVRKDGDSLFSREGRLFYLTAFVLFLLAVYLPRWRNYWCYAAAWNYLYPTVILMYFLSLFRKDVSRRSSPICCLFVFIVGLISGWGTECTSVVFLPLLSCIVIYNLFGKQAWLSFRAYVGYCGYMCGATLLFCSPALYMRAQLENASKVIDVSKMTGAEYHEFIHNLNWDRVEQLRGFSAIVTLKDIPLFDRIYFLPFLGDRFLSCCCVALCFWLLLVITFAISAHNARRGSIILRSSVAAVLSVASAFSYSVQCIPSQMSFLPAGFALVIASMYLYTRYNNIKGMTIYCAVVLLVGIAVFLPTGIQAAYYKPLEVDMFQQVARAKANGEESIILRPCSYTLWCPTLGFLAHNDIKDEPLRYPNDVFAKGVGLKAISRPRSRIMKADSVPSWIFPEPDRKFLDASKTER